MLACETGSESADRLDGLLNSLPEQSIGIAFNPGNLIVNDCFDEQSIKACASRTLCVIAKLSWLAALVLIFAQPIWFRATLR